MCFRISHERIPNETCTFVFCHEHGDANVNPDHIRVVPTRERIKDVNQAIAAPRALLSVAAPNVTENLDAVIIKKDQGTAGRTWDDAAIDFAQRGRASPCLVADRAVG